MMYSKWTLLLLPYIYLELSGWEKLLDNAKVKDKINDCWWGTSPKQALSAVNYHHPGCNRNG